MILTQHIAANESPGPTAYVLAKRRGVGDNQEANDDSV